MKYNLIYIIIALATNVILGQNDNHDDDPRFTKAITLSPPPAFQNDNQQYVNLNAYKVRNITANSYSNSINNNIFIPSQPITHLNPITPLQQLQRQQFEQQNSLQRQVSQQVPLQQSQFLLPRQQQLQQNQAQAQSTQSQLQYQQQKLPQQQLPQQTLQQHFTQQKLQQQFSQQNLQQPLPPQALQQRFPQQPNRQQQILQPPGPQHLVTNQQLQQQKIQQQQQQHIQYQKYQQQQLIEQQKQQFQQQQQLHQHQIQQQQQIQQQEEQHQQAIQQVNQQEPFQPEQGNSQDFNKQSTQIQHNQYQTTVPFTPPTESPITAPQTTVTPKSPIQEVPAPILNSDSMTSPKKTYKTYKIIIEKHRNPSSSASLSPINSGSPRTQILNIIYQKPSASISSRGKSLPKKVSSDSNRAKNLLQGRSLSYVLAPNHVNLPKLRAASKNIGTNFLGSFSEDELVQIVRAISPENFNLLKISKQLNMKPIIKPIPPSAPIYPKYYNSYTHGNYVQVIPNEQKVSHHTNANKANTYQRSASNAIGESINSNSVHHKRETLLGQGISSNVLTQFPPRFMVLRKRAF